MLVQRPVHLELEIMKWVIVLVIATAFFLGLIVSSSAGADAESKSEPKLLPPDIQVTAKPMLATDVESSPVARLPDQVTSHRDNLAVWEAIQRLEGKGSLEELATRWEDLALSPNAETWRWVVVGLLHMDDGEHSKAARAFMTAENASPGNPVAHYGLAVLRLKQAGMAWDRLPSPGPFRLAVLRTPTGDADSSVAPNTKSMYEYVAMMELRRALRLGGDLDANQRLLDTDWTTPAADEIGSSMPLETARVGDLLEALDVADYETRSHTLLGRLYLRQGMPEKAYEHLRKGRQGTDARTTEAQPAPKARLLSN